MWEIREEQIMNIKDLEVKRITRDETKPFILLIHYARRMPQLIYAFGLFEKKKLIGVCTFGYPATPYIKESMLKEKTDDDIVLELNRLVILPEKNGENYGSFFVSKCLKMLPKSYIVSYADSGWTHCGYIYQATNWWYTGISKGRINIYCAGKHARHSDLHRDTEFKQIESEKYRYIYLCGNKKERKEMIRNINWEMSKNYPKSVETKYNVDNPKPHNKLLGKALKQTETGFEVVEINKINNYLIIIKL